VATLSGFLPNSGTSALSTSGDKLRKLEHHESKQVRTASYTSLRTVSFDSSRPNRSRICLENSRQGGRGGRRIDQPAEKPTP
jgi:hypothetical protein